MEEIKEINESPQEIEESTEAIHEEEKEQSTVNTEVVFSDLKKYVDIKINEVLEKIKSPEIEEKKEEIEEIEIW